MEKIEEKQYILGIDIGTTSVKVCVLDTSSRAVVAKQSKDTAANIPSDQGVEGNKQDVPKIFSAVQGCVSRLPKELLRKVVSIGVCGQMHGVVMWCTRDKPAWDKIEKEVGGGVRFEAVRERMSALYTWQDTRCKPDFLATLPPPDSHLRCYSGYACATVLWLASHKPHKLQQYDCAATVQDFIVAMLCGLQKPVTSDQNAASWGYYNTEKREWNKSVLESAGFPTRLLPEVVLSGQEVGVLTDCWYGLPAGINVGAALGDLQCSFLATLESSSDAVLNISTSAQLGFIVSDIGAEHQTVEYLPYFSGKYLAVAASLNGGNVLATFVKTLQQWALDLGCAIPQSKVWEKLISLGQETDVESPMKITPVLLGERHAPHERASVSNINLSSLGLGHVFRSMCEGIIRNLHSMMPRQLLVEANIQRIVGNGSGLSRNAVLQKAVTHYYSLPLEFTSGGDAARGAAVAVIPLSSNQPPNIKPINKHT